MPIVGGLDIHRKQITFDYLDTVTGEVQRGQIAPADRAHLRGLAGAGSPAATMSRSRWRGAPAGGTSPRSWPRPGSRAHVGEPADTAVRRAAASGTPRPTRPTPGTCGSCWPRAGCRSAGSRRRRSWSAGRCWRPTTTCAASTPPGCSASTRCCSTRAPRALGEGALRTEQGLAALRAAAAAHLSPAGQLQVATALDMLAAHRGPAGRAAAPAAAMPPGT